MSTQTYVSTEHYDMMKPPKPEKPTGLGSAGSLSEQAWRDYESNLVPYNTQGMTIRPLSENLQTEDFAGVAEVRQLLDRVGNAPQQMIKTMFPIDKSILDSARNQAQRSSDAKQVGQNYYESRERPIENVIYQTVMGNVTASGIKPVAQKVSDYELWPEQDSLNMLNQVQKQVEFQNSRMGRAMKTLKETFSPTKDANTIMDDYMPQ